MSSSNEFRSTKTYVKVRSTKMVDLLERCSTKLKLVELGELPAAATGYAPQPCTDLFFFFFFLLLSPTLFTAPPPPWAHLARRGRYHRSREVTTVTPGEAARPAAPATGKVAPPRMGDGSPAPRTGQQHHGMGARASTRKKEPAHGPRVQRRRPLAALLAPRPHHRRPHPSPPLARLRSRGICERVLRPWLHEREA